jgi:hypothetical protein
MIIARSTECSMDAAGSTAVYRQKIKIIGIGRAKVALKKNGSVQ